MFSPSATLMKIPLLNRWIPSLLRRYARYFHHRYLIEKRMGALFIIDQHNIIDRNLLIKGAWERPQIEKIKDLICKHRRQDQSLVFLDIGAHAALYSIIIAKEALADRIVAFEPEPTNLIQLKANLFINDMIGRIEVIEKAASDKAGRLAFLVGFDANRGGAGIEQDHIASKGARRIEVEADTLDSMVRVDNAFVIGKIDVEGAELSVLNGMEKTISENRCLFQIESFTDRFPALKMRMEQLGFAYVETIDFDHYFLKDRI